MTPNPELCPLDIKDSLHRYNYDHIPTGGFLRAVLENDLKEAIGRADYINAAALPHIVAYCYEYLPSNSWGNKEKVVQWLKTT